MQETWVQSLGREGPLEEEMATHSSVLARRIPWTEEPGGLQSMGVAKSRTGLSTQRKKGRERRERLPTPVFLSGELHGQRSLVGYNPWGHKESDMAE